MPHVSTLGRGFCHPHRIRNSLQPQSPRIVPPHHHRKRILKPQPRLYPNLIPRGIQLTHPPKHRRLVPLSYRRQRLLQNRRQRRPRVLHIPINPSTHQRLLAQITPRQIKPPLHRLPGYRLNLLRQQLSQHHLLRKILRPNRDPRRLAAAHTQQRTGTDQSRSSSELAGPPMISEPGSSSLHHATSRTRQLKVIKRPQPSSNRSTTNPNFSSTRTDAAFSINRGDNPLQLQLIESKVHKGPPRLTRKSMSPERARQESPSTASACNSVRPSDADTGRIAPYSSPPPSESSPTSPAGP